MGKEKVLERVVELLAKKLRLKALILFGSRARGDWSPWSDYDLLVIADFDEQYLDRIKKLLDILSEIPLEIEPHPYTLQEALEMLKRGNPIIVDALEEGIVLYTTEDLNKLVETYRELRRRGLRRSETSIILPPQ